MQRGVRLARGLGLLGRSFSAAAEPAAAEDGMHAAITGLRQRLAAGETEHQWGAALLPIGGGSWRQAAANPPSQPACCCRLTVCPCALAAGPDLGDFIRGSDLAGYSVPAPKPKVSGWALSPTPPQPSPQPYRMQCWLGDIEHAWPGCLVPENSPFLLHLLQLALCRCPPWPLPALAAASHRLPTQPLPPSAGPPLPSPPVCRSGCASQTG